MSVIAGGPVSSKVHVAKFCDRIRLIRSVLRAPTFSVLKLIEIVMLWLYYTILIGFIFGTSFSNFWNYFFG